MAACAGVPLWHLILASEEQGLSSPLCSSLLAWPSSSSHSREHTRDPETTEDNLKLLLLVSTRKQPGQDLFLGSLSQGRFPAYLLAGHRARGQLLTLPWEGPKHFPLSRSRADLSCHLNRRGVVCLPYLNVKPTHLLKDTPCLHY